MPEADTELNSMTETLNGLMVDSLPGDSFEMESGNAMNEETNAILQEAEAVASQQTDENFHRYQQFQQFQQDLHPKRNLIQWISLNRC